MCVCVCESECVCACLSYIIEVIQVNFDLVGTFLVPNLETSL